MLELNSLLPKLKRVEGTQLSVSDVARLREFFAQFVNESDVELERKRGVMRERLRVPIFILRNEDGAATVRNAKWADPDLDAAKFEILTAIIQYRTRTKLQPRESRKEEILQLKPGLWGMNIDIKALGRRLFKRVR